jgi:pimeloyl-ACP methyl ester carboxylesterase
MLEPYDPDKIPVLMVHGLWSNLITWMEMFNDLRGTPEIRNHYQFWFYLYPTGQPFWMTASQMRSDLARARRELDPRLDTPALDQLVLVGHSMGGLIAQMQTLESGNNFWHLVSDERLTEVSAPGPIVDTLRRALYFGPNPAVKRVVTIASPHRGSNLSNGATQWLGRRLINLPDTIHRTIDQVAGLKADKTDATRLLKARTSIDSLSPDSPMLLTMRRARKAPWVKYHNVIGRIAEEGFLSRVAGESDGIVTTESARIEDAVSEKIVAADHMNIHRHPITVLEVQRVLLEHLDEVSRTAMQRLPTPSISRLPER